MSKLIKTHYMEDGTKIEFARLTIDDLDNLADDIISERERLARDVAKSQKLDLEQTTDLVIRIKSVKPTQEDLYRTTFTPSGAKKVCEKALIKAGFKEKTNDVLNSMRTKELFTLANALILDDPIEEKPKEEVKEKNDESPS